MANFSHPVPFARDALLLDFPLRLYTALQTNRLYPDGSPQIQRSNELLMESFRELRKTEAKERVVLAVSDRNLLVCGQQLPDDDQQRPQIQGLTIFFSRVRMHSLSFSPAFSLKDCTRLTHTLSTQFSVKQRTMPVAALLNRAGLFSVAVDAERYVAIHEGEQVVHEPLSGSGTNIATKTPADAALVNTPAGAALPKSSREQVRELINRLSPPGSSEQPSEAITSALVDFLREHSREQDSPKRSFEIALTAGMLSTLDPPLLTKLITTLSDSGELHQPAEQRTAPTSHAGEAAASQRLLTGSGSSGTSAPLADILGSQHVIDLEPQHLIRDEGYWTIWGELTHRLGTEAFRALAGAFTEQRYRPRETIVRQGEKNDALFFINQGSIKVSHLTGLRELFITSLRRGQLAGESFFIPSLWTTTLTTLTSCQLYLLPPNALAPWRERFPELQGKLYEYYQSYNDIGSILKKKGLTRRQKQRFTISRTIQVQPINDLDSTIGRGFRSETADISLGGLAFLIRIARPENARLLLGRRMRIVLPVGGKINLLHVNGLVIGLQPFRQGNTDFFVHFRFEHPITPQELQTILG